MSKDNLFLKDDFEGDINREIWGIDRIPKMIADHSWTISSDYAQNGKTSLKITCNHGDIVITGEGQKATERAEIFEKKELWLSHHTNVWYSFSFLIPNDFVISDNRLVLAQCKQAENLYSPFLSLRYINGNFEVKLCSLNEQKRHKLKNINRGSWNNVLLNYELAKNQIGQVKVWLNETNIVDYNGELGFPDTPDAIHFSMGIYRDELNISQTIYFDRFRRGSSRESVL